MNIATKTMPWMVASLVAATSLFGQMQPQGGRLTPSNNGSQAPAMPTGSGYNAPALINIGMQGDVDVFLSGSFIYWQPTQDNMAIAVVNTNTVAQVFTTGLGFRGKLVDMDFKFKPGFKVGGGINLQVDDWDGYAEYTSLYGSHDTSSNGSGTGGVNSVYPTWGDPLFYTSIIGAGNVFQTVSGHFNNNLNFLDAEMGRSYYVGKKLVFRPAYGARAAWITQNMHVAYSNLNTPPVPAAYSPTTIVQAAPGNVDVYARTHSWGLGPRMGLGMDWMFDCGLRYFGSGYADILFTQYKLQNKTVLLPLPALVTFTAPLTATLTANTPVTATSYDEVNALRTHLDLEMGFGWGSYFDNNNWHVDLSLAYGFQVFFNQNMFPTYNNAQSIGSNEYQLGNMYVQGMTFTARFDF